MKKILLFSTLIISISTLAQNWQWAKSTNASSGGYVRSVATNTIGNIIVAGRFTKPSITFGSTTLINNTSNNTSDMFLAIYDTSGNALWATKGTSGDAPKQANSVAIDANNNMLVAGSFSGSSITFGSTTLTNSGMFLAKYDASANFLWAKGAPGGVASSISTDVNSNILVTGTFSSATITFGSTTLTNVGGDDMFLVKYDASGNVLWAKSAGGGLSDVANSVKTDTSGNIFVAGAFLSSTITFGNAILTNAWATDADMFLAKYDALGNVLWARRAGGLYSDFATSIATDSSSNVFVAGSFYGATITFGSTTLTNAGNNSTDMFLAKYDAAGNILWAKRAGGNNSEQDGSVAIDANGNILMAGNFQSPSITFGSTTLIKSGSQSMFLAKYSTTGNILSAKSTNGGFYDQAYSVTCDINNNIFVGGAFNGTITFSSTTLTASNGDIFLARLGQCNLSTPSITPASSTTFCQGNSVTLTSSSANSYLWSTSATTQSITVSSTGNYSVTVTDVNSCSATSSATTVTVNTLPTASITASGITTFCQGGNVVLNANTGTGLTYQWKQNGTNISGATSASYTANTAGNYTVVVTNTSSCSTTSAATTVTVNTLPTASITASGTTTFCQGGNVVLNANTGAGLTYQWRQNGTNIFGASSASYTANASGSYTVVETNSSTCSATSTAISVTVNALPTASITAGGSITICQGGSVFLNANTGSGLTYQWKQNGTNISGATSPSYTANISGSYTVVVTNSSTCSATSSITTVTVNALPAASITAGGSTTICQGGSVILNANTGSGLTYQWKQNGTNISGATSISYTANTAGNYTVVVTNSSSCSTTSSASTVTVNALPTASITAGGTTTFCQGGNVLLNANTGSGLTYQWALNGTNISGATAASYTANASGNYTLIVTNSASCSATSSATAVTVNTLPAATITAGGTTTFCQGGNVGLNANTGTGLTYQWQQNSTNISGATSASYTANTGGNYTVIVSNTSSCSATSSVTSVTVNALPTATNTAVGSTTFCQGGNVILNANTGSGLSYQWALNGTNITGATAASYTASATGSYAVIVTNSFSCSTTSTGITITANPLPTATNTAAGSTTFCQGGSVVLNANTGSGLSYQWTLNGTNITGATAVSYSANATGNYAVIVTNNTSSCAATSTTTTVTVNSLPLASNAAAGSTTFCQGGDVVLNANTGTGLTYQWQENGTNISGATGASYTTGSSGNFVVVVTDNNSCSATSSATTVTVDTLPIVTLGFITSPVCDNNPAIALSGNPSGGTYSGTGVSGSNFDPAVSGTGTFTVFYQYTDVNSCFAIDSQAVNVSLCTGITKELSASLISIFPNPASTALNISGLTKNNITITVTNVLGENVKTIETIGNPTLEINVESFTNGVYFIKINNRSYKFIKA